MIHWRVEGFKVCAINLNSSSCYDIKDVPLELLVGRIRVAI